MNDTKITDGKAVFAAMVSFVMFLYLSESGFDDDLLITSHAIGGFMAVLAVSSFFTLIIYLLKIPFKKIVFITSVLLLTVIVLTAQRG